ncbi:uncharacterized protein CANTADRAFT_26093 [Suhomyces tanzawaensis NRRL Y-17324]|uniref:Peptidase M48 domain-containing protein n=1 Tax=Suhomyces tanzawaensis NRRL Y-17324 TaxID=984487 RepID=A0A1E4SHM9_9ASCO|nr:uncharacterized protein CANTADRAFT_26093 [Suhomyces tanzawaensis NRRL Y-17324]ODV79011.1 hypothetical protein CANTADRAFT_26093 [Suhomyces tanzawaensis NRRL Y-17324]
MFRSRPFMASVMASARTNLKRTANRFPSRFQYTPSRHYASYRRFDNSPTPSITLTNFLYNRNNIYLGLGLVAVYVYNLDEAPFTHRSRFIWIPYWLERKIGDYSYQQILYQYQNDIVPSSDPLYGRIRTIMNRLLTSAINYSDNEKQREHLKSLDWTIHVIKVDPNKVPPNAFILPNGKIFIFSSILPICHDDNGLATVLSHELSHQLAHHTLEQLSSQPFYIMLSAILYSLTGTAGLNDLLILGMLQMPASREMESEADHIGCELLARLCYDVQEAVKFWGRMSDFEARMNGSGRQALLQEFFSTHPATGKRIHDIQGWLPELEHIKESLGCYQYGMGDFNRLKTEFFGKK